MAEKEKVDFRQLLSLNNWWYAEEAFCCFVDFAGNMWVIHGVKMNTGNAVSYQVYDLVDGVGNTCVTDCFGMIGIAVHHVGELFWKNSVCHAYHSFN